MRRIYIVLFLGLGLIFQSLVFGQHNDKGAQKYMTSETDSENIDPGLKYYTIYCSLCHGLNGKGAQEVAKSFEIEPSSLVSGEVKALTDKELFSITSDGVEGTMMLPWKKVLTEDEIQAIVSHIRVLQDKS